MVTIPGCQMLFDHRLVVPVAGLRPQPQWLHGPCFTYLMWDMQPQAGWLPTDHPAGEHLESDRYRPLYLGMARSWKEVKRHFRNDLFGCGTMPTFKNVINEGLVAYCLGKTEANWLGMSIQNHPSSPEAEKVELAGVQCLEWRRDVVAKKLLPVSVRNAIFTARADPAEKRRVLAKLREHHGPLHDAATPTEGILFNQGYPRPDHRGR